MTGNDVIKKVLKNISREDILLTNLFLQNGITPTTEQQELVNDILECLNDTIESVVYIYCPLKTKEEVTAVDGKILFSSLSKTLVDVVSLKDKNDGFVNFSMFPNYLEVDDGTYVLTFNYLPDLLTTPSEMVDIPYGKITTRVLATGTTSKFFLKRGMFQDANVWDVSFQRLLLVAGRPKHFPVLPPRGWF